MVVGMTYIVYGLYYNKVTVYNVNIYYIYIHINVCVYAQTLRTVHCTRECISYI